jgi:enoyl-CoA hydratase/carnithine racemase
MSYETIIYEKAEGVATLTFNRPQAMNAGNMQLYGEMGTAMQSAMDDDSVKVLIITGAGRAFHAGDDVKQIFVGKDSWRDEFQPLERLYAGHRRPFWVRSYVEKTDDCRS